MILILVISPEYWMYYGLFITITQPSSLESELGFRANSALALLVTAGKKVLHHLWQSNIPHNNLSKSSTLSSYISFHLHMLLYDTYVIYLLWYKGHLLWYETIYIQKWRPKTNCCETYVIFKCLLPNLNLRQGLNVKNSGKVHVLFEPKNCREKPYKIIASVYVLNLRACIKINT